MLRLSVGMKIKRCSLIMICDKTTTSSTLMRSWVATTRVPRSDGGAILAKYQDMLTALSGLDGGVGCPIPDTVVLRRGHCWLYSCDGSFQVSCHNVDSLGSVLRERFAMRAPSEDAHAVCASWCTEREDSSGFVWTSEFLSTSQLDAFADVACRDRLSGVLQVFVRPRLHRGINDVSHSVMAFYSGLTGDCALERWYIRDCFLSGEGHPTVRAHLLPTVSISGRTTMSRELPLDTKDLCPVYSEVVNDAHDLQLTITHTLQRVAFCMECARAERCGADVLDVQPVRAITAEFRFSAEDDLLYLCNVLSLRHPGDVNSATSSTETARVLPCGVDIREPPHSLIDEFAVDPNQLARSRRKMRYVDWRAPAVKRAPALVSDSRQRCPNCTKSIEDGGGRGHIVGIGAIVDWFARAEQAVRPADAPPGRIGMWLEPPPALARLSAAVDTIAVSNIWRSKTILLCTKCFHDFGSPATEDGNAGTPRKIVRGSEARTMPPMEEGMVFTALQQRHLSEVKLRNYTKHRAKPPSTVAGTATRRPSTPRQPSASTRRAFTPFTGTRRKSAQGSMPEVSSAVPSDGEIERLLAALTEYPDTNMLSQEPVHRWERLRLSTDESRMLSSIIGGPGIL